MSLSELWTMPVVVMQPLVEHAGAFVGVSIDEGVGPFSQGRLDEALGLAVGARRVGARTNVSKTEPLQRLAEGVRDEGRAVVGHDATDLDTELGVVGDGSLEEGDGEPTVSSAASSA